ncbi:MAG: cobalt transporter [Massilioclostridium sp.]|nr:MAG: cobalt transporter [Massilioclostridium sp.]
MPDAFTAYHPIVNFVYFAAVLVFTMFCMNPICITISVGCALLYAFCLQGFKLVKFVVRFAFPTVVFVCIINPLFNHRGQTVLAYLPWGNPLTMESLLFGFAAAILLLSVIFWFSCCNRVMTTDKFLYLFGRIVPSLSLILSMALRFIPQFKEQFKQVRSAQKSLGCDLTEGSLRQRFLNAANIFSIMITWSLENAVQTADSMKNRGYGLPGRTAYSVYQFERRDGLLLCVLACLIVYVSVGLFGNGFDFYYFPVVKDIYFNSFMIAYFMLCATPLILNGREVIRWKYLQSKI